MATGIGCSGKCIYCVEGNKEQLSPKNEAVISEIMELRKYGDNFFLCESEFNNNIKNSMDLMDMIYRNNIDIKYQAYIKPGNITDEYVEKLKNSGCKTISLNIDSLDDSVLKLLNKDYTRKDVEDTFKLLKKHDMEFGAFFVVGFPWDTKESIKECIEFCHNMGAKYSSYNLGVRVYPNTQFEKMIDSKEIEVKEKLFGVLEDNSNYLKPIFYINDLSLVEEIEKLGKEYNVCVPGKFKS